jgi:hypothetical protein
MLKVLVVAAPASSARSMALSEWPVRLITVPAWLGLMAVLACMAPMAALEWLDHMAAPGCVALMALEWLGNMAAPGCVGTMALE